MFVRRFKRGVERPAVRRLRFGLAAELRRLAALVDADSAARFAKLSKQLAMAPATAATLAEIKTACDQVLEN